MKPTPPIEMGETGGFVPSGTAWMQRQDIAAPRSAARITAVEKGTAAAIEGAHIQKGEEILAWLVKHWKQVGIAGGVILFLLLTRPR